MACRSRDPPDTLQSQWIGMLLCACNRWVSSFPACTRMRRGCDVHGCTVHLEIALGLKIHSLVIQHIDEALCFWCSLIVGRKSSFFARIITRVASYTLRIMRCDMSMYVVGHRALRAMPVVHGTVAPFSMTSRVARCSASSCRPRRTA